MRAARKRARALDNRVNSPGHGALKPVSSTYSSSASTGYSPWTSSSLSCFGSPRVTAEKLAKVSGRLDMRGSGAGELWVGGVYNPDRSGGNPEGRISLPVDSVEGPEHLLADLTRRGTQSKTLL